VPPFGGGREVVMDIDKAINIRPKSPQNTVLCIIALLGPVGLLAFSFLSLFDEKSYVGFVFGLVCAIVAGYFLAKPVLWKVSFIGTKIFAAKAYAQLEKLDVECSQILNCDVSLYNMINTCFLFDCVDGKKRGLAITLFSNKQRLRILEMIKERGGLQEQNNFGEIVNRF